ncbi:MAG: hypothetical protein AB7O59_00905 [Pirellulales bacterium]
MLSEQALMDFQSEVASQGRMALLSFEDLLLALAHPGEQKINMLRFWKAVQSLLVFSGNVSKLFWPPDPKYKARGVQLRASLGVEDDNALNDRKLRNCFEHFDEHLEEWLKEHEGKGLVDHCIANRNVLTSIKPEIYRRLYEPETYSVIFIGEQFPLRPIEEALWKVVKKADLVVAEYHESWHLRARSAALHR